MAPSITPQQLVDRLCAEGIITELGLISLLGRARHNLTLNVLECALVDHSVLSAERLATYKADLSGKKVYTPGMVTISASLPEEVAKQYGVLLVDQPDPLILMVEDTDENTDAIRQLANGAPFQVGLVTAPHFAEMRDAAYSGKSYDAHPEAGDIFDIIDAAMARDASDVLLAVGVQPGVRVDGALERLDFRPLDKAWLRDQIPKLAEPRHLRDLETKYSCDLAYRYGTARFRVNIAHNVSGPTFAFRQLPTEIPSAEKIGLPDVIRRFAYLERGLVLVTGPTGSGKSTTLATTLLEAIVNTKRHLITLEDPVEFALPRDQASFVNQRELGESLASFPDGIRDALRQNPDIVLVGEMRDAETTKTALALAESGHLVFGTLHTFDAPSTVSRIVNMFPGNEQDNARNLLAQLLKGIVSQTLAPRQAGKGRVAAYEILVNTPNIATNLRKPDGQNALKQVMQTSAKEGMQTMEVALANLVHTGIISEAEGRFRARDEAEFQRSLEFARRRL